MEDSYSWDWGILFCTVEDTDTGCVGPYFYWIVEGFGWTVAVASAAWVIAFSLGSVLGVLRTLDKPILWAVPFVTSPIYFRTRAIATSKDAL